MAIKFTKYFKEGDIIPLKSILDITKRAKYMFDEATITDDFFNIINPNDFENVEDISYICRKVQTLTKIPAINTKNVKKFNGAFTQMSKTTNVYIEFNPDDINISNAEYLNEMFSQTSVRGVTDAWVNTAKSVKSIANLFLMNPCIGGDWVLNLPKCLSMYQTFKETNLKSLKITAPLTDILSAFKGCKALTKVEFIGIPDTGLTKLGEAFTGGCKSLEEVIGLKFEPNANISLYSDLFDSYCTNLTKIEFYNIPKSIKIGSGTSWGHLLTVDSLVHCCKECMETGTNNTLTVGSTNLEKLSSVYVKVTGEAYVIEGSKRKDYTAGCTNIPCEVCESTDEGAMLISDYMALKNWTLA